MTLLLPFDRVLIIINNYFNPSNYNYGDYVKFFEIYYSLILIYENLCSTPHFLQQNHTQRWSHQKSGLFLLNPIKGSLRVQPGFGVISEKPGFPSTFSDSFESIIYFISVLWVLKCICTRQDILFSKTMKNQFEETHLIVYLLF